MTEIDIHALKLARIKDPEIAEAWKDITVKRAMNPCPID